MIIKQSLHIIRGSYIVLRDAVIDQVVDFKTSWRLTTIIEVLEAKVKREDKYRNKLIDKYAVYKDGVRQTTESGGVMIADKDGLERELAELQNREVEVEIKKVPIEAFEQLKLTARQTFTIKWLIEGDIDGEEVDTQPVTDDGLDSDDNAKVDNTSTTTETAA